MTAARRWRWGISGSVLIIWAGLVATYCTGLFLPLDNALHDFAFRWSNRPATGDTVFVDIDSKSLAAVGVWPWPRSIHAQLLDDLMRLGSGVVAFDVDFSAASTPQEDQKFERALANAGHFALLAGFKQKSATGQLVENLPLANFATQADTVSVNVLLDPDGMVRTYPLCITLAGKPFSSLAAVLANAEPQIGRRFSLDYGIDPSTVPRISAADLLAGKVPAALVAGKNVVIGASAIELRDYFVVPRYGVMPGALLQIMAAETLAQGQALRQAGNVPVLVGLLLLLVAGFFIRRRVPLWIIVPGVLALAIVLEGASIWMQVDGNLLLDAAPLLGGLGLVVLQAMVEELIDRAEQRRKAEARLRYLGSHDPITGTLNRTAFLDAIDRAQIELGSVVVILVDLRRFRAVNDTIGHEQGDELLRQVSARLQGDPVRTCARLGGDTFAVLVPDAPAEALAALAVRLTTAVSEPYRLPAGHEARIAASAGVSTTRFSGSSATLLLEHADMALSTARHALGNGVAFFDPHMEETLQRRQAMDSALSRAVDADLFTMSYQPIIDLAAGRVAGAEALMRWRDPVLGDVSPGIFIPAAEETGQIVALGRFALREACRIAAAWDEDLRISVNVSPVQFELSDVFLDISEALAESGLAASRLDIEITEGIFVRDAKAVSAKLVAIRELGVGVALDDFGTGYSSLIYLAELPIDKIKIDQAFIRRLPEDSEATAIVSAVLSLGRSLGKTIVAEGIETRAQADLLRVGACGFGQGYLFGRPVPAEQFAREHLSPRRRKQDAA